MTIYAKIHSHVRIYVYISMTNVLCIYCINIHFYVDNICLLYIIQFFILKILHIDIYHPVSGTH